MPAGLIGTKPSALMDLASLYDGMQIDPDSSLTEESRCIIPPLERFVFILPRLI